MCTYVLARCKDEWKSLFLGFHLFQFDNIDGITSMKYLGRNLDLELNSV